MPLFERRHYQAFASMLRDDCHGFTLREREAFADKLARLFASDNYRFKPSLFYAASDIEAPSARSRWSSDYDSLRDDGYSCGVNTGSWVVDGNTGEDWAKWFLAAVDEGDPEVWDLMPNPLSGEWADDPTPRDILARCNVENVSDEDESELLDYWQAGFQQGWETEVIRSCRSLLGLVPADLRR